MKHKQNAGARIAVIAVTIVVWSLFATATLTADGNSTDDKLLIIGFLVALAAAVIIPTWAAR